MSSRKQITIRIGPDGTVSAETHGFTGEDCLSVIPLLEETLQAETQDSRFTPEYLEAQGHVDVPIESEPVQGMEERQHE